MVGHGQLGWRECSGFIHGERHDQRRVLRSLSYFAIDAAGFSNAPTDGLFGLELGADNASLYLTYTGGSAVPEPGTWAAAALLAGAAGFVRWRRRNSSGRMEGQSTI